MAYSARIALITAVICVSLLITAFYLEVVSGLEPCALCLGQRIMFAVIGISSLLYIIPFYTSRSIFGFICFVSSILGMWLASRQLWLQSLPKNEIPRCGPDIYFMIERFPIIDTLQNMFLGSGNCAEIQWTFLSLSIPGWALLFYVFTAISSAWITLFKGPRPFKLFKN